MLLILTSKSDLAADFLIADLIDRSLPYFRLNSEEIAHLDTAFSANRGSVLRRLAQGQRSIDLADVSSVWYRRAIQPAPHSVSSAEQRFVVGELRHLVTGLVLDPSARWVNPIDRVYVAEHKLYQLQVAQRLGFRIPRTLVSSDAVELAEFVRANDGGTICKPIFHGLFVDGEERYAVYTRRVSSDHFSSAALEACPVLLQEEVPRDVDVRATFVGDRCFVANVHSDSSSVDWRDPRVDSQYSKSELSQNDEQRCRTMLRELGLHYGAFDFVRTPDGDLVFLEVNPTGEWAWLENELGFPIRQAFVDLLYEDES